MDICELLRERLDRYTEISRRKGYFVPKDEKMRMREKFLSRWAPEKLAGLSGMQLLVSMFGSKEDDSLTYWLEKKHTNDFYSLAFGNISGGYADNFVLFKYSAIGGRWASKLIRKDASPGEKERIALPEEFAVRFAELIRDTLLKGAEQVERLALGKISYGELEQSLGRIHREFVSSIPGDILPYVRVPQNIFHRAWVHKYFHILWPEFISGFHASSALMFVPISLAHRAEWGSYENDGVLRLIVSGCGYADFYEVELIDRRYPVKYTYTKLSTAEPVIKRQMDRLLKTGTLVWEGKPPRAIRDMYAGGRVFVVDEDGHLLAYGVVSDSFSGGAAGIDFAFVGVGDKVALRSRDSVKLYKGGGLVRYADELVSVERCVLKMRFRGIGRMFRFLPDLPDDVARVWVRLRRKKQVILYGPPGTGKTYLALKAAQHIIARENFGREYDESLADEVLKYLELVTFHPTYSYDDFVEGIRVQLRDGGVSYSVKDGILRSICRDAEKDSDHIYILIIDEINRGDTARIFGELITLIEADKRGKVKVKLPLSGEDFIVPSNLYIIGTMNTSDRSISGIDVALMRRFGFIRMWPDYSLLDGHSVDGIDLGKYLRHINDRLREELGDMANDLLLGHSYLMVSGEPIRDIAQLRQTLEGEIVPLLEEYFKGDLGAVRRVLGESVVLADGRLPDKDEELRQAILDWLGVQPVIEDEPDTD